MVFGISSDDSLTTLRRFRDDLQLTCPILFDEDGSVHATYLQELAFEPTVYPQDWIIGATGVTGEGISAALFRRAARGGVGGVGSNSAVDGAR